MVERLELMSKLEKHDGCFNSLNFNKAGNLLVTGSDDLKIVVWKWATNTALHVLDTEHNSNVFQSKFIENDENKYGLNIVTSARDGDVRLLTISPSGSETCRLLVSHRRGVHKIALPETNPNEILTAGEDGLVVRYDLREKKSEKVIQLRYNGSKVSLYSIAAHPFDPEFCVCGRDQYVRVYDKRNTKESMKTYCPDVILNVCTSNSICVCVQEKNCYILL